MRFQSQAAENNPLPYRSELCIFAHRTPTGVSDEGIVMRMICRAAPWVLLALLGSTGARAADAPVPTPPLEWTDPDDIALGAQLLMETMIRVANEPI